MSSTHTRSCALLALGVMVSAACVPAVAADTDLSLVDLSLEQLSNIVVTSVSRRDEPLADAPASIYVISAEDIRRSGATSLPEALRLAPNLDVARVDTNQYAISARGFNNLLANKMLVLIDGRTVYTPLFSGVFWEAQDVMLEDVARIEVISGPGATLWGANAVNGVINIITRSAKETQGNLVSVGGGNREYGTTVRHGGELGADGHYRVYGKFFHRDNSQRSDGSDIRDASNHGQAGIRADWGNARQSFTLQGMPTMGTSIRCHLFRARSRGRISSPAGTASSSAERISICRRTTIAPPAIIQAPSTTGRASYPCGRR